MKQIGELVLALLWHWYIYWIITLDKAHDFDYGITTIRNDDGRLLDVVLNSWQSYGLLVGTFSSIVYMLILLEKKEL